MRSYVINLRSRPERLAHIQAEFGQAGIAFERFEAIGRDDFAKYPLARALPPRGDGRPWLPFEVGCLLSHVGLWKCIAKGDEPFAAIFEDDVVVSSKLGATLDGDFPADADLVKLETTCQITYVSRRRIPTKKGGGCFRRLLSVHEGTGAYIISRRGAALLAEAAAHFDEPLDHSLFSPRVASKLGLKVYQADPAVALQGIFVPSLRDSSLMRSDRLEDFKLAPIVSSHTKRFDVALHAVRRLWRQARGRRKVIPFASEPSADRALADGDSGRR